LKIRLIQGKGIKQVWNQLRWIGPLKTFKWLFSGQKSFDTYYPADFFLFNKGTQYDYTNARLDFNTITRNKDPNFGWDEEPAPIKPEGCPVPLETWGWIGAVELGNWWSLQFKTRWFIIRFRYRSWDKNIFYIARI
jgi:hypothetical protein